MKSAEEWLRQFTRLNPAVNRKLGSGNERFAPHKPLLLLCLLELAEEGKLLEPRVGLTPDLVLRFGSFWRIVVARWTTKPDVRMPFHYLSNQHLWEPMTEDLRRSTHFAATHSVNVDPSLMSALQDCEFRQRARAVLISHYFPVVEQIALRDLTGLSFQQVQTAAAAVKEAAIEYARTTARDARFRIQVVSGYLFTCALTGYSLTTVSNSSIVDAAHIHERRDSNNDDPRNGLALSKNAHWMFDEGLWSITKDFHIIVAEKRFTDWSPDGFSLKQFHGKPLFFREGCTLRPDPQYVIWHRENRFRR